MRLPAALALLLGLPASAVAAERYVDPVFPRVAVERGIAYGTAPGRDGAPEVLLLDHYRPRGDRVARRPAVVWVHGGGFAGGSRAHRTLRALARSSARRGFVAVSADYRLLARRGCEVTEPACRDIAFADQHDVQAAVRWLRIAFADQHDVQAAVRWLRRHAARLRVDPRRVAVAGTSVGGILSYLVATRPEDPGASGNPGFSSRVRAFVSIAGGWPGTGFASPGDAPGLLWHGDADDVTPFAWSTDAARGLRGAGVPAELVRLPRGRHVAFEVYGDRYVERSHRFLAARLGVR